MSQTHNENSRVKIPAVLHLMRLGYDYLSLKNENWDKQTNIFPKIFIESLCRINPNLSPDDARRLLANIRLELDNEDLGQKFYERLTNQSGGKKLIDFQNFNNNSFHVVTELPCINGDEEFRPDITLLVNGMPLVFIEVKNQNYFEKQMQGIVLKRFRTEQQFPVQPQDIQAINRLLVREYLEEKSRICGSGFSGSLNHL